MGMGMEKKEWYEEEERVSREAAFYSRGKQKQGGGKKRIDFGIGGVGLMGMTWEGKERRCLGVLSVFGCVVLICWRVSTPMC